MSEEHIIIALALSTDEDAVRALHELLGDYDAAAVTSGALVKIASTGRAAARTPSVEARQASDNTIKWLQKASRFAIAPDGAEKPLTPAHLVQAAGDQEPDDPVRRFVIGAFDEALIVGLPQSQFARTRQSLTSISQTAGRTKTQTVRLREAMRVLTGADGQTGELSRVVDASVSAASASIETDLKKLTTSVDGSRAKLGELDRAVAEIRFNLQDAPEPVSPVSLALAIVAVLGLGTLAGLLIGRL